MEIVIRSSRTGAILTEKYAGWLKSQVDNNLSIYSGDMIVAVDGQIAKVKSIKINPVKDQATLMVVERG